MISFLKPVAGAFALVAAVAVAQAQDIVVADFESRSYGDWRIEGNAFGEGPARGTLPDQMKVSGYKGNRLVNTYHGGDASVGTLTSPPFKIERKYVSFLIGGGNHPAGAYIELLVDDAQVRTATGKDSERLTWHNWDVSDLAGQTARIKIVDNQTGGWGHVNIDQIVQSDEPRTTKDLVREMEIAKKYLNFPIKNGSEMRRLRVSIDGRVMREFDIELAEGEPDFWAFLDVSVFAGKTAVITAVESWDEDAKVLGAISQDDGIKGTEDLYREKLRPQFHFSSRRGWLNDPNGLVYYEGEYHLFYQHNPYGIRWGNMHWGHAVSTDLVHWQELPIALYPHQYDDFCFSGSGFVDHNNTGGFKAGDEAPLIAAYTSTGRGESIAFSNDKGRTWTDYEGNPVVKHRGRDPKVIWHEPSAKWVMVVYDETDDKRSIMFHGSTDLKNWEYLCKVDDFFECPDLFELPVDGDKDNKRWVLLGADGDYVIGRFDGRVFTTESGKHRGNHGNCFYASQTWSDIPAEDGRRIQIAWARIEIPGMPFNQMMSFPCELALVTTPEGIRMTAQPVAEIAGLYEKTHEFSGLTLEPDRNPLGDVASNLLDISAELEPAAGVEEVGFSIRGVPVAYNVAKQEITCNDKTAPLAMDGRKVRLRILVDVASIEVFGNGGIMAMIMGHVFDDNAKGVEVFTRGGQTIASELTVRELRSAWK